MSKEVLQKVMDVLDEIKAIDDKRQAHTKRLSDLARRVRAGEDVRGERDAYFSQPVVFDYGDVWNDLKALRPLVRKALK